MVTSCSGATAVTSCSSLLTWQQLLALLVLAGLRPISCQLPHVYDLTWFTPPTESNGEAISNYYSAKLQPTDDHGAAGSRDRAEPLFGQDSGDKRTQAGIVI